MTLLKIRDIRIDKVKNTKYLGINIDNELKWDVHIENMCQKLSKLIGFLGRLRHVINESSLNTIYKTVILPHFDYGDVVWQSASKNSLFSLQKLQNRAGRIIMKVNPFSHVSNQHVHEKFKLMWKSLEYCYTKHLCTMVYKILNNLTPNYMTENITFKTSDYALRSNQNLNLPKPKTNSCKRTFFLHGSFML